VARLAKSGDADSALENSLAQAADRGTPFQETLKAIDDMHKQGKFKTFAISNFTSAEVSQRPEPSTSLLCLAQDIDTRSFSGRSPRSA